MPDLARFLFQSSHFSASKGRVRAGAFNPGRRTELSVFEVAGLDFASRAAIGQAISELQSRPLRAWAELPLRALKALPLAFIRDDMPIERHGNIVGWPEGDEDESRAARTELSAILAQQASLVIPQDDQAA